MLRKKNELRMMASYTLNGGNHMAMHTSETGAATQLMRKRPAKAVLTGATGYSAGRATRHGSSSLTRFTGQSAITFSTCRR